MKLKWKFQTEFKFANRKVAVHTEETLKAKREVVKYPKRPDLNETLFYFESDDLNRIFYSEEELIAAHA